MMRSILVASLLGCIIVFTACWLRENRVKMTFVNKSDELLCFDLSSADAASGDTCSEIKGRDTTVWRPGCSPSGNQPLTVVLTVGQGGPEVYNRTATCNEWKESGAKFTIQQRGDEFVVTDPLADATPGP
jgi:hypothetical protein